MAVPIGALVVWCAFLVMILSGPHPFDLTTGVIFFGFGLCVYVVGCIVGGVSAIRAIARARKTKQNVPRITRFLVGAMAVFIAFPWVAIPVLQIARGLR